MSSFAKRVIEFVINIIEKLCIISLMALVIFLFAQVFFRYVIPISLPWTEELVRYLFIWNVFIGAGVAVFRDKHIKVGLLVEKFPLSIKKKHKLLLYLVVIIILIVVFRQSVIFLLGLRGQTTMSLRIPRVIPYSSVCVGILIMILSLIYQIIDYFD